MNSSQFVSLNGKIIQEHEAVVPAYQSGIFYGTGCFETMLVENKVIFRFSEHYRRLMAGLNYLGVNIDDVLSENSLKKEIDELKEAAGYAQKTVQMRVQYFLSEKKGYGFDQSAELFRFITCKPVERSDKKLCLITAKTRVVPDICRPSHMKLSNLLHYRNAFREARSASADDALMLTVNGFIAETSIANIFWKKGDHIYTPSDLCDILPGIMRNSIIEIIHDSSAFQVKEGKFYMRSLLEADSVWCTNSVMEIREVSELDNTALSQDSGFISYLCKELNKLKSEEMNR